MKFTCLKENLIKSLSVTSKLSTSTKNISLPILGNVLIIAQNDGVELTATNLEIGVKVKMRGKTEQEGKTTIPARALSGIVNYLPNEKVEFEIQGGEAKITSGDWKTVLKTQSAEEYPLIPEVEKKTKIKIKANDFKKALSQTVFAAVSNESRPELSGGLFKIKDDELKLVATDSYRLAEKKVKLIQGVKSEVSFIVPVKTLQEVLRVIGEGESEEEITAYFEENQVMFVMSNIELTSRLIDGEYPDYEQIIPQTSQTQVVFSKNEMVNAVKAASVFSKTGIYDVTLNFDKSGKISVRSANTQIGENLANIDAEVTGESNEIVFNYHYFLEGLSNLSHDKIDIKLINSDSPALLKEVGNEDYLYLIMPIRQ